MPQPPKSRRGSTAASYDFELPAGGELHLQSLEEVELLETHRDRYMGDYQFEKQNDLVLLGAILTQQLILYRAQQTLSGMEPEFVNGKPTGGYKQKAMKPAEQTAAHSALTKAAEQIMAMEKSLAIDKKARESGGQHTLQSYLVGLKRAAHSMGVHIAERTKAYEEFAMELRTKLRLLDNADAEDRQYHGVSEKSVLNFCRDTLKELEQVDKDFANQKGQLWLGRL